MPDEQTTPSPMEHPWRRIGSALVRPSWGQAFTGLLLGVVALGVVTQVHAQQGDQSYSSLRRSDLVQLLDQLNGEQARLNDEVERLQRTRNQLASGADARRVAQAEQRKRAEELGILNGTVAAHGPGVRLTIVDPQGKVGPDILLDAVEEMRDAGAEAMEVNDQVRIVGSSWFGGTPGRLEVDGQPVGNPITIDVIGEPHALEEGARFRGGLVSQVESAQVGGQVHISRLEDVQVASLRATRPPQWSRPA